MADYVEAVCREIAVRSGATDSSLPVRTIYFGGGTPSRLSAAQLGSILNALSECYDTGSVEEMTIEVNPENPDDTYLAELLELGFTRLSIGLQSVDDDDLEFMHRSHAAGEAKIFIERAVNAGFQSVSLDLIFGLPGMDKTKWQRSLDYAVSSGVEHVSLYGLTVEPGTLLGKWVRSGAVIPSSDEAMASQFTLAHDFMLSRGFDHYEISNFARPGHRSRHNQSYWDHANYVGFGPAAHSFLRTGHGRRWENVRSLRLYLEQIGNDELPVSIAETLDKERLMQEYVLLSLRTDTGISLEKLRYEYGYSLQQSDLEILDDLEASGMLLRDDDRLRLTVEGFLLADSITSALLTSGAIRSVD